MPLISIMTIIGRALATKSHQIGKVINRFWDACLGDIIHSSGGHSELEEACIVHLRNASRVIDIVVLGFTVTFVRRRQVPNTCATLTVLPSAVSSFGQDSAPTARKSMETIPALTPT
jgi:hypothetical protein